MTPTGEDIRARLSEFASRWSVYGGLQALIARARVGRRSLIATVASG